MTVYRQWTNVGLYTLVLRRIVPIFNVVYIHFTLAPFHHTPPGTMSSHTGYPQTLTKTELLLGGIVSWVYKLWYLWYKWAIAEHVEKSGLPGIIET